MKAPEKIYLGIQDMGSGYIYNLSLDDNGEQKYIRKDALLTWLNDVENIYNKETEGNPGADGKYYLGMCDALEMVVEKLNSI